MAAAALLLACMAASAPTAIAAPPANDDFADAEALPPGTGVVVTRSSVEATQETGEAVGGFAAGHSVWFEWEATTTGFVTIGACDGDFKTVLRVFTGTTLDSLTSVGNSNADEGPGCPFSQREFVFKATSGTTYRIAVDGNAFSLPGSPPPAAEGTFTLRIETTPLPVNDDFQDSATIAGMIEEEPGGNRFLIGSEFGFNWGATKEAGEPDHAGDPGGASVWYSWTAPEAGSARVSVCCGGPDLLGVYTGDSVATAATVAAVEGFGEFPVAAGVTYRFAVDGKFNAGPGARVGSFLIRVSMELAPKPGQPPTGPPSPTLTKDTAPPNTRVTRRVVRSRKREATFTFASTEPGGKFRCKLDRRRFVICSSPRTYRGLEPGKHTLAVIAVDAAGNEDPTPATAQLKISKPRPSPTRAR